MLSAPKNCYEGFGDCSSDSIRLLFLLAKLVIVDIMALSFLNFRCSLANLRYSSRPRVLASAYDYGELAVLARGLSGDCEESCRGYYMKNGRTFCGVAEDVAMLWGKGLVSGSFIFSELRLYI